MRNLLPSRSLIVTAVLLALLVGAGGFASAQRGQRPAPVVRQAPARQQQAAPIERRAPGPVARGPMIGPAPVGPSDPKGHLGEWMARHSNLPPTQQQQALEREPGFRQLPPQQQVRMRERLAQLDAMPPQQRQRIIEQNEAIERLNPEQRAQWRGAMSQLGSLPPDQRQMVARSFRELRQLPPEQRFAAMNTARYSYLNPIQRETLTNLIRVAPMMPPPEPPQPR